MKNRLITAILVMLQGWLVSCPTALFALDTDIYQADVKNNAYLLMDNSGSMSFGVYQHTIDYGAMFDYFFTLNDNPDGDYQDYIYDTINNSDFFYQNHQVRRKIYLWKGKIGVTIATIDGEDKAFTGDAADPDYLWYMSNVVDTHTLIDSDGNLSDDGTNQQRLTVDNDGHILLDGSRLPLGQDISLHDFQRLYDGSRIDRGFGGLLNAPGYYFSGYEGVGVNQLDVAEDGDEDIFFFVTGNWMNMQSMYNLHYTTNSGLPDGAHNGDMAWRYEDFPISSASWLEQAYSVKYPDTTDPTATCSAGALVNLCYTDNLNGAARTITLPGASRIQVHFSRLDIEASTDDEFRYDYLAVYNPANQRVVRYDNEHQPTDGWSETVTGDTVTLKLYTDGSVHYSGYEIDKIRVVYSTDDQGNYYRMQSRLDVAQDAMNYVIDEFSGRINWGYASFNHANDSWGDGASLGVILDPGTSDTANRQAMHTAINNAEADGGTPLGESLQDIFEDGYYAHRDLLSNLSCARNYIIAMTDGFPSGDTDWSRVGNVPEFEDFDGDHWTNDPYQYETPPPDYYDDVAHWLYTHSLRDKSEVNDPESSYENVTTHHISFGAYHPLLEDAAGESGGLYIAAYNKEQLISAFYSLGLMISKSVAFSAPVVSVDAANKIQNGDDIYMGLFMPKMGQTWVGNVKRFILGDGSSARPNKNMIYDAANNEALDDSGVFLDNTAAFWGDDTDANDHDSHGGADIQEDGAGEVLVERLAADFANSTYWERDIYTYKNGSMTPFNRDEITPGDLGVADDAARDELINYTYGYTSEADPTTHAPLALRDWVLGAVIHSQPTIIDYYDTNDPDHPLVKRLIAVGANDGMLHVFENTTGEEVFAFIPDDILPRLTLISHEDFVPSVDGHITLYRKDNIPKYLIFGERRGGGSYWAIDVSNQDPRNWTVKWKYTNNEIKQSWSKVEISSILTHIDQNSGARTYKDVAIFSAGYDPEEDNFPEPFDDLDNNGTPYDANGQLLDNGTAKEWDGSNPEYDLNGNHSYDMFNPDMNEFGRGIFIVDIDDPDNTVTNPIQPSQNLLPFSVTYGTSDVTEGNTQTLEKMKFCFPANVSVVHEADNYKLSNGRRAVHPHSLRQVYAPDVYGDIFKVTFKADVNETSSGYEIGEIGWQVDHIFSANPGSQSTSGEMGQGENLQDQGRKMFEPPAVSWKGTEGYFSPQNYVFSPDNTFVGTEKIASLFFGTGDREHPKYTMIRNRFYAVYDDSSVSRKYPDPNHSGEYLTVAISAVPYTENNLLNLSGDEMGPNTIITQCYAPDAGYVNGSDCSATVDYDDDGDTDNDDVNLQMKEYLTKLLTDDVTNRAGDALENGSEDDAKGWYIILEDQASCTHCAYAAVLDTIDSMSRDNHHGEKVAAKPVLYNSRIYFTTYQPAFDDPCSPQGNGFNYGLNYGDGSAALNYNEDNDSNSTDALDVTDRYRKHTGIDGYPSGFSVIIRDGVAQVIGNFGGGVVGGGKPKKTNPPKDDPFGFEVPSPGLGLDLYYWLEK